MLPIGPKIDFEKKKKQSRNIHIQVNDTFLYVRQRTATSNQFLFILELLIRYSG